MSSPSSPLVSVVLPVYNGVSYLPDALVSLQSQSYRHLEIIVCDDGSKDGTREFLRDFQKKEPRLKVFENAVNLGLTANLNYGIKQSSGKFICWLNQDDIFYPEKIERQLEIMRRQEDVGACFCAKEDIDAEGNRLEMFNPSTLQVKEEDLLFNLLGGSFLTATSVMIRREVFHTVGLFNEAYKIALDYEMWLRIRMKYRLFLLPEKLMAFRHHDTNQSSVRSKDIIALESASVVSSALKSFSLEEIFPYLREYSSEEGDERTIGYAGAALRLASHLWGQKVWNRFLVTECFSLLATAVHLNPDFIEAYRFGCELAKETGNREAEEEFHAKRCRKELKYRSFTEQLQSCFQEKHFESLPELVRVLYGLSPFSGDVYFLLAEGFLKAGNREEAMVYCDTALKTNPRHSQAQSLMEQLNR